jgi:putative aldouronate transport system substrate-binding protein
MSAIDSVPRSNANAFQILLAAIFSACMSSAVRADDNFRGLTTPSPISPTPIELSIHLHFADKYVWNDSGPVSKELTRLTNLRLKNVASKVATKSSEQFNLLIASRKIPDIVAGDNLKDNFIRFGMDGAFLPLNQLIETHAPHLRDFLRRNPLIAKAITAPDGNIYHIPYLPDGQTARGWWIRQDWLDKLGLKAPETVQELETVLRAFRDRDPNGNGKKDEVPWFNGMPEEVYRLVMLWGARSGIAQSDFDFVVTNDRVVHPFAEPEFKGAIKQVARWYAEGLIDKEIFTRKSRAREQLFGSNRGGMTRDWFASTGSFNQPQSIPSRVPGFKLVAIAPPADINGKRLEEDGRKLVMPDGWAISYTNKHPEATIKLFDFMFSPTGRRLANFGVEGLQYDMKDGKPVFKDALLKSGKPVAPQLRNLGAQIPIGFPQDYEYEAQWTFESAKAGRSLYINGGYLMPQFPGVNLSREERAVYDRYWPDLRDYMREVAQNWVLGTKDVDQSWDDYQRKLERNGLSKVIAAMNSAYKRQYLNTKN